MGMVYGSFQVFLGGIGMVSSGLLLWGKYGRYIGCLWML